MQIFPVTLQKSKPVNNALRFVTFGLTSLALISYL